MLPPAPVEQTSDVLAAGVFSCESSTGMQESSRQCRLSEEAVKRIKFATSASCQARGFPCPQDDRKMTPPGVS